MFVHEILYHEMKKIKPGTNFTIFILFFGIGMLEAFQTQNWLEAFFWVTIGIVFLAADTLKKPLN